MKEYGRCNHFLPYYRTRSEEGVHCISRTLPRIMHSDSHSISSKLGRRPLPECHAPADCGTPRQSAGTWKCAPLEAASGTLASSNKEALC